MDHADKRFDELLRRLLDGESSPAERDELGRLIIEDERLAEWYVDQASIHSLLEWQGEDVSSELAAFHAAGASPPSAAPRIVWWATAAALLMAVGVGAWQVIRYGLADYAAVAEIVDERGVQWTSDSTALGRGGRIGPGRLKNRAGSYSLQFRSGTRLDVVGAASLDIESAMLVGLDWGQATARVTETGKGFTLETAAVDIVDQGTQFGVAAGEDGGADVIVFEGSVDLHRKRPAAGGVVRLVQGEAVRIDRAGMVERLVQVQRDANGGWWSMAHPDFDSLIITQVSDNLPAEPGVRNFCYQIGVHGLEDDQYAYADHLHQWNGLTAKGLPKFLRGADYVKTFNDYRYLNDFEVTVELAAPANVYIFFDDRVPLPDWLKERFEDTGVDIGLDEGYHREVPDHTVGAGGGNSIDNVFSVWRRRCPEAGRVTLGAVGRSPEARAMYGIAATPLDADGAAPLESMGD